MIRSRSPFLFLKLVVVCEFFQEMGRPYSILLFILILKAEELVKLRETQQGLYKEQIFTHFFYIRKGKDRVN